LLGLFMGVFAWHFLTDAQPTDAQTHPPLKVVATTSVIAEIVADLGGPGVDVITLIPPASCPGHFDIKPDDMRRLADAHLFLMHDWQGRQFSEGLLRAAGNRNLNRVVLQVEGNWMTPHTQIEATERVAALLIEIDPPRSDTYRTAAARRKTEVERAGAAQAQRLLTAGVQRLAVLVNVMQAGFVNWAGFQVAGDFGRGEDMSPRDMQDAISLSRSKAVRLVIDNLQSGKQAGIGIAKAVGAAQVTLSNFPGGFPDTPSWATAFEKNVDLLVAAIAEKP
jgi:ABC-type Zn uptake system ZnuABC Zn-binding protein ZnuA